MNIAIFLLIAGLVIWILLRRPQQRLRHSLQDTGMSPEQNRTPADEIDSSVSMPPQYSLTSESPAESTPDERAIPPALATFSLVDVATLNSDIRDKLNTCLKAIPRPPRAFHRLVSPELLSSVTSEELVDLVMGEPLIAAKVLGQVNSSRYGLQRPVLQIGQAITFLGLNTVRSICVQYMLDESFKADTPGLQKIFDDIWNASAVASDLCFRLAQKLQLPNSGAMATQVVLSYIGHLAAAILLPRDITVTVAGASLLERAKVEQEYLGVAACGLSRLLMAHWSLPAALINEVSAIDHTLVAPQDNIVKPESAEQLALCYLSARLGEQLVQRHLTSLTAIRNWDELGTDYFHLARYMELPRLARWADALHAPDLNNAIGHLLYSHANA